jgi:hypothetical protein
LAEYDYKSEEYRLPGLEWVGEISWSDESYSFDLTGVWKDAATGRLYWVDDSGCSCPSPYETVSSRHDLIDGTKTELARHLRERATGDQVFEALRLLDRADEVVSR